MDSTKAVLKKKKYKNKVYETFVTTIPKKIEEFLNLKKGSIIKWKQNDNGEVSINNDSKD